MNGVRLIRQTHPLWIINELNLSDMAKLKSCVVRGVLVPRESKFVSLQWTNLSLDRKGDAKASKIQHPTVLIDLLTLVREQ